MPTGYHEDHRSVKHLARLVVTGVLPLPQFYAAAAERLVTPERAEKLLIETREQIDAETKATAESAAQWAQSIIDARRQRTDQIELPLTAGRWIAQSVGENAVLVKPQPIGVKVGCIDV